ncbi:MAG: tetratricopeptide repeat protein [Minwuiales bacterium]|nr:tetratricopeptide repeat protein [Minwuiales bacterium]
MAKETVLRRLATVVCADVAGYSRLMGVDEAGTLAAFKAHRREVIDPLVTKHRGRLVSAAGDGLLLEFASVVDAVSCAVAVQERMAERNADLPDDRRMLLRFGINLADVIVDGDDIHGDGVNVASRLETLADPGAICLSGPVYDQVHNRLDLDYADLGDLPVKNIAEPVRTYMVRTAAMAAEQPSTPPQPESARGSIAVLPFESLSRGDDDAYLADGITSEVISMLSRVPDLRVTSRVASFAYRVRGGVHGVVRDLGPSYILTGNVRRAGDRIRVIAELSDAADGTQLWSNRYDREFADFLAVQEELAEAIVIAFGGEYLRAEWRRASHRPTDSLNAWGLVQKAKTRHIPDNRAAIDEALDLGHRAVELDPAYAGAHASVASTLMFRVINGFSAQPEEDRKMALAAADRASRLASTDPAVLRSLGNVWSNCGAHGKAVRALRRAVELAPFDFHSWGRLGRTLAYGGGAEELAEGHAILDRILASAPNHPMVPFWLYFKANACMKDERYEEAADFARRSIELQPGYSGAWLALANALGRLGRSDEAREAMDRAREANPDMTPEHLAAQIRILSGEEGADDKALAGLRAAGLL